MVRREKQRVERFSFLSFRLLASNWTTLSLKNSTNLSWKRPFLIWSSVSVKTFRKSSFCTKDHQRSRKKPVQLRRIQYWAEMVSKLPENDVRYVATDVFYDINDGPRNDIYFIAWAPDTATIKRKMLCASSKDALKNALHGIRVNMQATCKSDLDLDSIISDRLKSK